MLQPTSRLIPPNHCGQPMFWDFTVASYVCSRCEHRI